MCAGDWLKYGFVDAAKQDLLAAAALLGLAAHVVIGGACAYAAARCGSDGAAVTLAALRGFAAGAPELVRAVASLRVDAAGAD
jgi:hypothetical protein